MLTPTEIPLWRLVIAQFRLPEPTDHGAPHWLNASNRTAATKPIGMARRILPTHLFQPSDKPKKQEKTH